MHQFQGNLIEQFGQSLPTPIVDSVSIRNDKIEVAVSLFFNFKDPETSQQDIDDYITYLSTRLQIYAVAVLGKEYADALINGENIDIFTEMWKLPGLSPATFKFEDEESYSWDGNYYQAAFTPASSGISGDGIFTPSNQNFYDEQQKIIQYSTVLPIEIQFRNSENIALYSLTLGDVENNMFLRSEPLKLQDLTIFAFSSFIDFSKISEPFPMTWAPSTQVDASFAQPSFIEFNIEDDNRSLKTAAIDLLPPLKKQQVSNISYESVFADGVPDVEPRPHFVDNTEAIYNKIPLQAIDGKFYSQDGATLKQIKATFKTLIEERKSAAEENEDIQSILDNISYVIETYGESNKLIIELNKIRETFPDKSSATEIGRMYTTFKDSFFGVNEKAIRGNPLFERLIKSSKIRDLRDIPEREWQAPDYATRHDPDYFYSYLGDGGYLSAVQIWSDAVPSAPEAFVKKGFWFFDYERALRERCNATSLFSLSTLDRVFGEGYVLANYRIVSATVRKYAWEDPHNTGQTLSDHDRDLASSETTVLPSRNLGEMAEIKSNISYVWSGHVDHSFAPMTSTCEYTPNNNIDALASAADSVPWATVIVPPIVQGAAMASMETGQLGVEEAGGQVTYMSYLALRGIDALDSYQLNEYLPQAGSGDKYKLLCFEFQDVEETFDVDTDQNIFYKFEVVIEDTTKYMIEAIVSKFQDYFDNELKPYYDRAQESCSYNNVDGKFNDFFTEAMMGYYVGYETKTYPWVVAPVLLNFQRDLLTNAYGGDAEKMLKEAEATAANINPINGTLPNLQAFFEAYEKILFDYLSAGTEITDGLENMDDNTTRTFLSHANGAMYPVPAPVPIVPSAIVESTSTGGSATAVIGAPPAPATSGGGSDNGSPAPITYSWKRKSTMPKISFGRKLNTSEQNTLEEWIKDKLDYFGMDSAYDAVANLKNEIGDWVYDKALVGGSGVHPFDEWFGSVGHLGPYNYDIRPQGTDGRYGDFVLRVWGEENPSARGVDAWVRVKLYRREED